MRIIKTGWYIFLSLLARLWLLLTLIPAMFRHYEPAIEAGFWVLYYDEVATLVWDGKD